MATYVTHYHTARPHRGIDPGIPAASDQRRQPGADPRINESTSSTAWSTNIAMRPDGSRALLRLCGSPPGGTTIYRSPSSPRSPRSPRTPRTPRTPVPKLASGCRTSVPATAPTRPVSSFRRSRPLRTRSVHRPGSAPRCPRTPRQCGPAVTGARRRPGHPLARVNARRLPRARQARRASRQKGPRERAWGKPVEPSAARQAPQPSSCVGWALYTAECVASGESKWRRQVDAGQT